MALRTNHYDVAFEEYLRHRRTPYVVVDERRRALLQQASLKSMDFIVYSETDRNLLVDVKGRRFPTAPATSGHKWENWATTDDLVSLYQWQRVFGGGFRSVLVFAYEVIDPRCLDQFSAPFEYQKRVYSFYGVWADDYHREMRTRSPKWETVTLPSRVFRELRQPIENFL